MATSDPKKDDQRFVILRQLRDLPEALLVKSILDSAGIECFIGDENTIRMDWFWSNLLGGLKICVRKADADAASGLLEQKIPGEFDVKGVGEYKQPRCPQCQSLDISFEGLNKPVTYSSFFLGVPVPVKRHRWKCHSCGHQWPESNETPQVVPP